jgi:hypothetical protein
MSAPRDSGLYWWLDRSKPLDGWTVVHVYPDGGALFYKFIGCPRAFKIDEIETCEWGSKLTRALNARVNTRMYS